MASLHGAPESRDGGGRDDERPSRRPVAGVALPVAPGDVIDGKYRIERAVGVGGMAAVFAATHLELHQRVAVKVLLAASAEDPRSVDRFVREARAAVRLKSVHAAHVFDVGALPTGLPFMVMELLDGEDLGALLRRRGRPVSVEQAVSWVGQACDAIAEAHALGIVHRDIKPGNLFLARQRGKVVVKVLDFGISKITHDGGRGHALTEETTIIGSPAYMSPEQIRASRDVDERSDVWSLGVVLYELLTGHCPFEGETSADIFVRVLERQPPPIAKLAPNVPVGLAEVIQRCLQKERELRFESVQALASELQRHAWSRGGVDASEPGGGSGPYSLRASGEPPVAVTVVSQARANRRTRRNMVLAGAALVAVASGLAVALALMSPSGVRPSARATAAPPPSPAALSVAFSSSEASGLARPLRGAADAPAAGSSEAASSSVRGSSEARPAASGSVRVPRLAAPPPRVGAPPQAPTRHSRTDW